MTERWKPTERSAPSPISSVPSTPRRYAIYARVSTATQRERETIQSQLSVLPGFVQRLGGELVATYIDDGVSGAAPMARRPETRRMLEAAEAGRFDTLAIIAIDRLTRADDWIDRAEVLGRLQRAGVTIAEYETGGTLDLRDPSGDLIASLRTSWAAQERAKIAERSRRGRDRSISLGALPAGVAPYGYRYDRRTRTWSTDPAEAAIVVEIYARLARGESCGQVARELTRRGAPTGRARRNGVSSWSVDKVYDVARSSTYQGEYMARRAAGESFAVPALVDASTWHAVQLELGRRRTDPGPIAPRPGAGERTYLLQGLAVCELCASPIRIVSPAPGAARAGRERGYYVCRARLRAQRGAGERCGLPYLRVETVNQLVWSSIASSLAEHTGDIARALATRPAQDAPDRDAVALRVAQLERAERAVLARFRRGLVTERAMDAELGAIAAERAQLADELERAPAQAEPTEAEIAGVLARLGELTKTDAPAERRALVVALVRPGGAVLGPDTIRIEALAGPWSEAGSGCVCCALGSRTRKQRATYAPRSRDSRALVRWAW
jgi:site-specific DNA recombinase